MNMKIDSFKLCQAITHAMISDDNGTESVIPELQKTKRLAN